MLPPNGFSGPEKKNVILCQHAHATVPRRNALSTGLSIRGAPKSVATRNTFRSGVMHTAWRGRNGALRTSRVRDDGGSPADRRSIEAPSGSPKAARFARAAPHALPAHDQVTGRARCRGGGGAELESGHAA
jgi:hypothetical protein